MSYFLLGYRRYGTMIFMGSLWIWHKIIRPVPIKRLILIGLFLLIFVFPTIKLIRGDVGEERLSINNIIYAYFSLESPVVAILNEMGGTIDTISYTLQLIPDYRPFALGSTYFYAFTSIFPNFFWDLHPAVEYGSLARWLIKTVDPSVFLRGGGLGYSFMAEAYANFGWIFGAFFVGVVGFFMAKLTLWAKGRGDNAKIAVVAICMANILLWSRGDATVVFRPLFYCAFLAYYGNKIVYKLLERYYLKKIN
jgi:oligosaccharide repeat unit polymerase